MGNVDELIQKYKQEAEQLSLTPSPRVWENVDKEINGGKHKKRFLFILIFLGLGCVLANGIYFFHSASRSRPVTHEKIIKPTKAQYVTNSKLEEVVSSTKEYTSVSKKEKTVAKSNKPQRTWSETSTIHAIVLRRYITKTESTGTRLDSHTASTQQEIIDTVYTDAENMAILEASNLQPIAEETSPTTSSNDTLSSRKPDLAVIERLPINTHQTSGNAFHTITPAVTAPPVVTSPIQMPASYRASYETEPRAIIEGIASLPILTPRTVAVPASKAMIVQTTPLPTFTIANMVQAPFIPLPPPYEADPFAVIHEAIPSLPVKPGQIFARHIPPALAAQPTPIPTIEPIFTNDDNKETGRSTTPIIVPRAKRWGISLFLAPTVNKHTISENGDYQFVKHYRDSSDKRLTSFNYGAGLHYVASRKLRIDLYAGLNKTGEQITTRQATYGSDTVQVAYTAITLASVTTMAVVTKRYYDINNDSTGHINNYISYLSLGAGVTYFALSGDKFRIGLQPTLYFDRRIVSNAYYYNSRDSIYEKGTDKTLNQWIVTMGLGIPFEYSLSNRMTASVSPYINTFMKPAFESNADVNQRYLQYGVRFSAAWLFK